MSATVSLRGFGDPVRSAQSAFRQIMRALSNPGTIFNLEADFVAPPPLMPGAAALALTLCDFETRIWLDPVLAAAAPVREFLAFNTGAPTVADPREAAFGFIADAAELPSLQQFSFGMLEYPDRSTTLVVQASSLADSGGWLLTGPGIAEQSRLAVGSIAARFAEERRALRASFPLGVDVIFVAGTAVAALPRSTYLTS